MDLPGNFADSCIFMQHLQFVAYSWNQRHLARIIRSRFWTWKANDESNEQVCESVRYLSVTAEDACDIVLLEFQRIECVLN